MPPVGRSVGRLPVRASRRPVPASAAAGRQRQGPGIPFPGGAAALLRAAGAGGAGGSRAPLLGLLLGVCFKDLAGVSHNNGFFFFFFKGILNFVSFGVPPPTPEEVVPNFL